MASDFWFPVSNSKLHKHRIILSLAVGYSGGGYERSERIILPVAGATMPNEAPDATYNPHHGPSIQQVSNTDHPSVCHKDIRIRPELVLNSSFKS